VDRFSRDFVGLRAVVSRSDDNVPLTEKRAVPITLDTLGGNLVVLDIGNGRYATYAHLIPQSLRVSVGARVRRGQVLGRLGNSGNSHPRISTSQLGGTGRRSGESFSSADTPPACRGRVAPLHRMQLRALPFELSRSRNDMVELSRTGGILVGKNLPMETGEPRL